MKESSYREIVAFQPGVGLVLGFLFLIKWGDLHLHVSFVGEEP